MILLVSSMNASDSLQDLLTTFTRLQRLSTPRIQSFISAVHARAMEFGTFFPLPLPRYIVFVRLSQYERFLLEEGKFPWGYLGGGYQRELAKAEAADSEPGSPLERVAVALFLRWSWADTVLREVLAILFEAQDEQERLTRASHPVKEYLTKFMRAASTRVDDILPFDNRSARVEALVNDPINGDFVRSLEQGVCPDRLHPLEVVVAPHPDDLHIWRLLAYVVQQWDSVMCRWRGVHYAAELSRRLSDHPPVRGEVYPFDFWKSYEPNNAVVAVQADEYESLGVPFSGSQESGLESSEAPKARSDDGALQREQSLVESSAVGELRNAKIILASISEADTERDASDNVSLTTTEPSLISVPQSEASDFDVLSLDSTISEVLQGMHAPESSSSDWPVHISLVHHTSDVWDLWIICRMISCHESTISYDQERGTGPSFWRLESHPSFAEFWEGLRASSVPPEGLFRNPKYFSRKGKFDLPPRLSGINHVRKLDLTYLCSLTI